MPARPVQTTASTPPHGTPLLRRLSAPVRLLPGFLIIGGQRGGTTSLYNYLVGHPDVAPATIKEVHYFDVNYEKGVNWYRTHFPIRFPIAVSGRSIRMTGESSPYYLFHPLAPQRVFALLPDVKLIALLRNPVDRAESHYYHERRVGVETLTLEQALACEEERLRGQAERIIADGNYCSSAFQDFSYQARGLYADQLATWFRFFPRDQFFIQDSETFYRDPATVLAHILTFLDLPPWAPAQFPRYNEGQYAPMSAETRARLQQYFAPHNRRLYDLLGTDFGWNDGDSR